MRIRNTPSLLNHAPCEPTPEPPQATDSEGAEDVTHGKTCAATQAQARQGQGAAGSARFRLPGPPRAGFKGAGPCPNPRARRSRPACSIWPGTWARYAARCTARRARYARSSLPYRAIDAIRQSQQRPASREDPNGIAIPHGRGRCLTARWLCPWSTNPVWLWRCARSRGLSPWRWPAQGGGYSGPSRHSGDLPCRRSGDHGRRRWRLLRQHRDDPAQVWVSGQSPGPPRWRLRTVSAATARQGLSIPLHGAAARALDAMAK
jgi:hypothetical protein